MYSDIGLAIKTTIAVVFFVVLLSYTIFFVLPENTVIQSTREDGIIENCTAMAYLLASVFAFVLFFGVRQGNDFGFIKTKRNVFFLIMGLLFFIVFGEEISWGQRIFGWATPAFLERLNWKNEMNIHNVDIFMTISMNRLFSAMCIAYSVLLTILNLTIRTVARGIKKINIPVVPMFMSLLFLINFVMPRVLNSYFLVDSHSVSEIKEFNFGILFLGLTIWFLCSLSPKPQGVK